MDDAFGFLKISRHPKVLYKINRQNKSRRATSFEKKKKKKKKKKKRENGVSAWHARGDHGERIEASERRHVG